MKNTVFTELTETCATELKTGTVTMTEKPSFLVEIGGCLQKAEKAVSCIIEPEVNDTVLTYKTSDGRCYILSILLRQSGNPANMPFENGVSINVNNGSIVLESPNMHFTAARRMSLSGAELKLRAQKGEAAIEKMRFSGVSLSTSWRTIKLAARNIDTVAERLIQKLKRSYRTVDEFEESKIGRLRILVNNRFFLKSKNTTVLADETVKLDGKKILLG